LCRRCAPADHALHAFSGHGEVKPTVNAYLGDAASTLADDAAAEIELGSVTA
jgi:uncharacterized caspase-like protein